MKHPASANIDAYIAGFSKDVQRVLQQVRLTVRKAASGAEEVISYGMPAFKYNGKVIIYFAGYKSHIGLYATPAGHAAFEKELSVYKQGRGSVQFPLNKEMPFDLISRIVQFRMKQQRVSATDFPPSISAPARRALENNGIKTLAQLAKNKESAIMKFHGIGKASLPKLRAALKEKGLGFKSEREQ